MSANARTAREISPEETGSFGLIDGFSAVYRKGVDCFAELQNQTIDCAVRQNKEAAEVWKRSLEKLPWWPRLSLLDSVGGTMDRYAEAQKAGIQIAVDQTHALLDMMKERTAAGNRAAGSISKFAEQGFEQSVAAQKRAVEAVIAETRSTFENTRDLFVVPGGEAVASTIRQGVEAVLDAQKELLETARRGRKPVPEVVGA